MFGPRVLVPTVALLLSAGCGYVHFGRWPGPGSGGSDDAGWAQKYSDLALEQKILKQELALARREGDSLRAALERTTAAGGNAELEARLHDATRELAMLRVERAKAEPAAAGPAPAPARAEAETQPKLGATRPDYTRLQDENARLRADLQRARNENAGLAEKLTAMTARSEQAQAALAQLNAELLAEKDARTRAEKTATAARAQLGAIMAAPNGAPATAGEGGAMPSSLLERAKAPPAGASATAELRTAPSP